MLQPFQTFRVLDGNGRVMIPIKLRRKLGFTDNCRVDFFVDEKNKMLGIRPVPAYEAVKLCLETIEWTARELCFERIDEIMEPLKELHKIFKAIEKDTKSKEG